MVPWWRANRREDERCVDRLVPEQHSFCMYPGGIGSSTAARTAAGLLLSLSVKSVRLNVVRRRIEAQTYKEDT